MHLLAKKGILMCNYTLLPCVMQSCQVANAVCITVTLWWTQKFSVAEVSAVHFKSPGTLSECHWIIPSYPPGTLTATNLNFLFHEIQNVCESKK